PSHDGGTRRGANKSHEPPNDARATPLSFAERRFGTGGEVRNMKVEVRILGLIRSIEIERIGPSQFRARTNDAAQIDSVEAAPKTYSVIINGRAFEAVVIPAAEGVLVRC